MLQNYPMQSTGQAIFEPYFEPDMFAISKTALTTPPIPSPAIKPAAQAKPIASNDLKFFLAQMYAIPAPMRVAVPSKMYLAAIQ
jgi:hypothetical protein